MRIGLTVPDNASDKDKAKAFEAALEATTRANLALASAGRLPDLVRAVESGRVRWKKEPPGQEEFDIASTVSGRGWGDCDDLAPWWTAQLRATGKDPKARAVVMRTGDRTWHALVRRSDGSLEDPSISAGMRSRSGIRGIANGPIDRAIAVQPWISGDGYNVALQQPLHGCGLVSMASGPDLKKGVMSAFNQHQLSGYDIRAGYGFQTAANRIAEHLGFAPLIPIAASMAAPMLSKIMPGGGGAPPPAGGGSGGGAPAGGGGAPGPFGQQGSMIVPAGPGGPVIVRF